MLGIRSAGRALSIHDEINSYEREEVREADKTANALTEDHKGAKKGITVTYFEPVSEGEEPVLPRLLEERHKIAAFKQTAPNPVYPEVVVKPDPNRPAFRFVDVGLRWLDSKVEQKRAKASIHRRNLRKGGPGPVSKPPKAEKTVSL